jgi:hypothetical protein
MILTPGNSLRKMMRMRSNGAGVERKFLPDGHLPRHGRICTIVAGAAIQVRFPSSLNCEKISAIICRDVACYVPTSIAG